MQVRMIGAMTAIVLMMVSAFAAEAEKANTDKASTEQNKMETEAEQVETTKANPRKVVFTESDENSKQTVVFRTAEKAPEHFNSWMFVWRAPVISKGAKIKYIVIQPDGKEYFKYNVGTPCCGTIELSYFGKESSGGNPSVFFNEHIYFKIMVSSGRMAFRFSPFPSVVMKVLNVPPEPQYFFLFFKSSNWKKTIKIIPAVMGKIELLAKE